MGTRGGGMAVYLLHEVYLIRKTYRALDSISSGFSERCERNICQAIKEINTQLPGTKLVYAFHSGIKPNIWCVCLVYSRPTFTGDARRRGFIFFFGAHRVCGKLYLAQMLVAHSEDTRFPGSIVFIFS